MKIIKTARLENNKKYIWLGDKRYGCKVGKHCVWISGAGIKIPWMFNGKIEAFHFWDKGLNKDQIERQVFNDESAFFDKESFNSIKEEYIMLKLLADIKMVPSIGDIVYIQNMIAPWLQKANHCDPIGCIGYEMEDAERCNKGHYTWDNFKKSVVDNGLIELSHHAEGDFKKKDNVVNGYLVDVRRTIWDMPRLTEQGHQFIADKWPIARKNQRDGIVPKAFKQDKQELINKVLKFGQFPYQQRKAAYQDYVLDNEYQDGTRQTLYRMDKMEISYDLKNKSVLSLGCQIGSICNECYMREARHITGIDNKRMYVECARAIARYNHFQVNYQVMDLMESGNVVHYIEDYYEQRGPIDIVFLLSMYKHIGCNGWQILKKIDFNVAYIESNNCPDGYDSNQAKQIEHELCSLFGCAKRIGMTDDRSPRCLWKVTKKT